MPKNRLITIEKALALRDKQRQFLTSPQRDTALQDTEDHLTALLVEHRTLKRALPGNSSTWVPGTPSDPRFTVPIDEQEKMCLTANVSCPNALRSRQEDYTRTGGFAYEPRYDGMLLRLTYNKRGVLTRACTQGDGLQGRDVLHRVGMIEDLPKEVSGEHVSVTGVVVFLKEDYQAYCDHFSLENTTPGHLATYLMGKEGDIDTRDDDDNEDDVPLYFIAFHANQAVRKRCKTYDKLTAWLQRQGFITPHRLSTYPTEDDLQDNQYPVNGLILKQTDLSHWETTPDLIWYRWVTALRCDTAVSRRFLKDVFWYFDNGVLQANAVCVANTHEMSQTETFILRYPSLWQRQKLAVGDILEIDERRGEVIGHLSTGFGERIRLPKQCHYCDTPLTVTAPHQLTCDNVAHCPSHWSVRGAKTFSPDGLDLWPRGKPVDLGEHKLTHLRDVVALMEKTVPEDKEHQVIRQIQKAFREKARTGRVANWLYATGLHQLSLARCYVLEQALFETHHPLSAAFVVNWLTHAEHLQGLFGLDSLAIVSDAMSQRQALLDFLAYCPWPDEQQQVLLPCPVLIALSDEISAKHYTLTQAMKARGWVVDSVITKQTACFLSGISGLSSHRYLAKRYGVPVIDTASLEIDDILHYVEAKHVL